MFDYPEGGRHRHAVHPGRTGGQGEPQPWFPAHLSVLALTGWATKLLRAFITTDKCFPGGTGFLNKDRSVDLDLIYKFGKSRGCTVAVTGEGETWVDLNFNKGIE